MKNYTVEMINTLTEEWLNGKTIKADKAWNRLFKTLNK